MGKENEEKDIDKKDDDLKDVDVVIEGEGEDKEERKGKKEDDERGAKDKGGEADDKEDRRAKKDEEDEFRGKKDDELTEEQRAKREKNREERKLRKERREAAERELQMLRREVQDLRERYTQTERRATSNEYQRIESGISDSVGQMEEAKRLAAQALKEQNGEAHAEAMEAYYEARSRAEYLTRMKHGFLAREEEDKKTPKVDPMIASHARAWMAKNTWYDPRGGDEDSKIAAAVDEALAAQGYDPKSPDYWKEFDKRLAKRLPHRVKLEERADVDELDDDIDDRPSRTQGSGRERAAPGKTTYKLSAARVAAMKEAGVWEDPKERAKHIKRYMEWDKENAQSGKTQGA